MATDNRRESERIRLSELKTTAERLINKWQKILRLQDWLVEIEVKRVRDLETGFEDSYAYCRPNYFSLQAHIVVRDPDDHTDEPHKFVFEQVILHELLHLYWAGTDVQEAENESFTGIAHEQAIDRLAWAFYNIHGEKQSNGLNNQGYNEFQRIP